MHAPCCRFIIYSVVLKSKCLAIGKGEHLDIAIMKPYFYHISYSDSLLYQCFRKATDLKKILLLGGSSYQISSITKAKELGYYAITCDFLPNNPGHKYANEYYNVSTTDKEAVLALARKQRVDGILCYASDPGAPTAAYVAEKMGLPGNPYESVEILSNKELFRDFLKSNGFFTPKAKAYSCAVDAKKELSEFRLPVIVKPIDSSGSKGITLLREPDKLEDQAIEALKHSRAGRFIVEEYIECDGYQVGGDGFAVNGKLVYCCFNNQHFEEGAPNPYIPVSISYPCAKPEQLQRKIQSEAQRLFDLLKIRSGAFDMEFRVTKDGNVYIVEIGARCGGNLRPQMAKYATGVDIVEYSIKAAMGEDCSDLTMRETIGLWANYKVNSKTGGRLKELWIDEGFKSSNIVESHIYFEPGDEVPQFTGSGGILGIIIAKFGNAGEMFDKLRRMDEYVRVEV